MTHQTPPETDSGDVPDIAPRDLAERLARGTGLVLLDVRESAERSFCAIGAPPGVVDLHVPVSLIPTRFDAIRSACATGPVVVYCHHGVRSRMVADWLRRNGCTPVFNLAGGIDAWSTEVDPGVPRYWNRTGG